MTVQRSVRVRVPRPGLVHAEVLVRHTVSSESFQLYLDELLAAFRSQAHFVLLLDTGPQRVLEAPYRDMQKEWNRQHQPEFAGRWLATSFAMPSRVMRGMLQAIFWATPPTYEVKLFSKVSDAEAWAQTVLQAHAVDGVDDEVTPT